MHKRGKFGLPAKPQKVVRQALRYVDEYQPALKDRFGYEEVYSKNITGTEDFYDVWDDPSWYAMHHLGSAFDMHSIYKASDKVFLAEQEACKASELDGEYIASWYRVNGEGTETIIDNQEPDFQGSETLILDGCVGEFEGVENFQPSKELRKRLHVTYKPNGKITISGYLDPWEVEYSYFTVLKGDLNSGEILDFWGNGSDLIKIELINKAQLIAEEETAKAAENKSSPLFDGRYSFDLFRYHDEKDWLEIGNGFVEVRNGEVIIDKDNSDLKTGSNELYDTFSGQINEKGKVSGSVELAYLFGKNSTEVFTLNGQIDKKIWGDSPREDFFRVYMLLAKE
jgi:hypothetical protein